MTNASLVHNCQYVQLWRIHTPSAEVGGVTVTASASDSTGAAIQWRNAPIDFPPGLQWFLFAMDASAVYAPSRKHRARPAQLIFMTDVEVYWMLWDIWIMAEVWKPECLKPGRLRVTNKRVSINHNSGGSFLDSDIYSSSTCSPFHFTSYLFLFYKLYRLGISLRLLSIADGATLANPGSSWKCIHDIYRAASSVRLAD